MKLFKFFQFAYLIFGVLFLYNAFSKWGETEAYSSLALGLLAIFMFFFKRKFNKKFENRDTKK